MKQLEANTAYIPNKTNVYGIYCGKAYTGTIVDSRSTPDGRGAIFNIMLDHPIEVFGNKKEKIEHWSNESSNTAWIK